MDTNTKEKLPKPLNFFLLTAEHTFLQHAIRHLSNTRSSLCYGFEAQPLSENKIKILLKIMFTPIKTVYPSLPFK